MFGDIFAFGDHQDNRRGAPACFGAVLLAMGHPEAEKGSAPGVINP